MTALSSTVLSRVAELLDDRGIRHGDLTEGAAHMNLNASDRGRVFVKVTRPGDSHDRFRNEVAAARWARSYGVAAPEPLFETPLVVLDEHGQARAVTAWAFLQPVGRPSLRDRALDVLDVIDQVTNVPVPPDAPLFDVDLYTQRIVTRLAGRNDDVSKMLLETAPDVGERIKELAATRPQKWCHADLHLGNVAWCLRGTPVVLDWELAAVAPLEMDLAQLLRSIFINTPDYAPDERLGVAAATAAEADARFDVDWGMIAALIRFRTASQTSHLLVQGHGPQLLAANLSLMAAPMDWMPGALSGVGEVTVRA